MQFRMMRAKETRRNCILRLRAGEAAAAAKGGALAVEAPGSCGDPLRRGEVTGWSRGRPGAAPHTPPGPPRSVGEVPATSSISVGLGGWEGGEETPVKEARPAPRRLAGSPGERLRWGLRAAGAGLPPESARQAGAARQPIAPTGRQGEQPRAGWAGSAADSGPGERTRGATSRGASHEQRSGNRSGPGSRAPPPAPRSASPRPQPHSAPAPDGRPRAAESGGESACPGRAAAYLPGERPPVRPRQSGSPGPRRPRLPRQQVPRAPRLGGSSGEHVGGGRGGRAGLRARAGRAASAGFPASSLIPGAPLQPRRCPSRRATPPALQAGLEGGCGT